MKRLKAWLPIVAISLAVVVLLGLTMNLYGAFDRPKKTYRIENPNNLFSSQSDLFIDGKTSFGMVTAGCSDGGVRIYGTSTQKCIIHLSEEFELEEGVTYTFSQGMKNVSSSTYYLAVRDKTNGIYYVGDMKDPPLTLAGSDVQGGSFTCSDTQNQYEVLLLIREEGVVIDQVVYPVLVEGTEPEEFFVTITK